MTSDELTFDKLQLQLAAHGVRLVAKAGWFWGALHWIVFVVTFGGNRWFATRYITTIGRMIAVPQSWIGRPLGIYDTATIQHERVHVAQFKRAGLGSARLGILPLALVYIFLPLPICFAWFRWMLERGAYVAGFRVLLEHGRKLDELVEVGVEQMTSGRYGWTLHPWIFRGYVHRFFERALRSARGRVPRTLHRGAV